MKKSQIMEGYKKDFIVFLVRSGALTFGSFTLKSGRQAPFFINTGMFQTGRQLSRLGCFYAKAIAANFDINSINVLFGPAYKGIPLVVAASINLYNEFGADCNYCFNRKEEKDHGEGGMLIGYKPKSGDKIIIVDDVITAGTSVKEVISLLEENCAGTVIHGGIVSVDRMEKGQDERSAIQMIEEDFGLKFSAIVTLDEIVNCLHNEKIDGKVVLDDEMLEKINAYRAKYGAKY